MARASLICLQGGAEATADPSRITRIPNQVADTRLGSNDSKACQAIRSPAVAANAEARAWIARSSPTIERRHTLSPRLPPTHSGDRPGAVLGRSHDARPCAIDCGAGVDARRCATMPKRAAEVEPSATNHAKQTHGAGRVLAPRYREQGSCSGTRLSSGPVWNHEQPGRALLRSLSSPVVPRRLRRVGVAGHRLDDGQVRAVVEQVGDERAPAVVGRKALSSSADDSLGKRTGT